VAIEIMERTNWPGWTYRPAHYAFWLLKETYVPLLGMLTLVWAALVFAPVGRSRRVIAAVAMALAVTWLFHMMHEIRE
jgi:hypothetical protein